MSRLLRLEQGALLLGLGKGSILRLVHAILPFGPQNALHVSIDASWRDGHASNVGLLEGNVGRDGIVDSFR